MPWYSAAVLRDVKMPIGAKLMQSSAMICLSAEMEKGIEKSGAKRSVGA